MLLLRVRHIAWKRIFVEKPSLSKTDSHKTRWKISICDIKSRNMSFTSHLLRWACGSLSKTNRRFKRTQFAQEIRKDPKMKKKTISVTVTYLLISKTGSSESQSWQSRRSASVAWRAFSIPGSFVGKQGDLRAEREIGEATHADFFCAIHFFGLFCLVFSSFFLFFQK